VTRERQRSAMCEGREDKMAHPEDPSLPCRLTIREEGASRCEQYEWDKERDEESRFLMRLNR